MSNVQPASPIYAVTTASGVRPTAWHPEASTVATRSAAYEPKRITASNPDSYMSIYQGTFNRPSSKDDDLRKPIVRSELESDAFRARENMYKSQDQQYRELIS